MRVVVDFDACQGHGVCMGIEPQVFDLRDDGYLYLLTENPPESDRAKIVDAVRSCPEGAISLED